MRMNKFYMPTLREDPQDAEIASHKLLLRAGMIRKTAAGLYSYLPLGYRIVRKVENIVREEMDNYGSQEIHMPVTQPREIWEESGRWKTFGPEMFKLKDRNNREFCLGPTAEEYFTDLVKGEIKSYKQLPLNIYQIQTKYRDEKRPRFGINRSREFLMKDAYTFDVDEEAMAEAYMNMWRAYEVVFNRLGLEYKIVAGDSGAMGGNSSHEFIALSERADIANRNNADLFVSMHFNSAGSPSAYGIEVLYASENDVALKKDCGDQTKLAREILNAVLKETGANSRGIKNRPELAVLRRTNMTACLIEGGFMSNPDELEQIKSDSYLDKLANGIVKGIENYNRKYM